MRHRIFVRGPPGGPPGGREHQTPSTKLQGDSPSELPRRFDDRRPGVSWWGERPREFDWLELALIRRRPAEQDCGGQARSDTYRRLTHGNKRDLLQVGRSLLRRPNIAFA